jgi:DNA-directed RNA polymerase alpha subunit
MEIEPLLKRLAKPAQRALQNAGIQSLEELAGCREEEIAALHGIGKNALQVVKTTLNESGLSFAREE